MELLVMSLVFGALVGFALGMTGGGGSIFAVPLLVYALSVPAQEAVGVSLAAVGATAAVGLIQRLRCREVAIQVGLLFAIAGMLGAPVGAWLNSLIPATWLLTLFAALMLVIAIRMWATTTKQSDDVGDVCVEAGKPNFTSQRALLLTALGLITGVLSGLFGVGGGFVIVPALVLFSGMSIHRAVATSLLVITLVSLSGVTSYLVADRPINFQLAGLFALGGVLGMFLGTVVGRRISGPALQRGFSVAIAAVAVVTAVKNFV